MCLHNGCIYYSEAQLPVLYHFRLTSWSNISGPVSLHCWQIKGADKECVVVEDRLEICLLRRLLMFRESWKQMNFLSSLLSEDVYFLMYYGFLCNRKFQTEIRSPFFFCLCPCGSTHNLPKDTFDSKIPHFHF